MNELIWTFLLIKTGFASNCPKLVKLTPLEMLGHSKLYGNFLNIFLQFALLSICIKSPRSLNIRKGKFSYSSNPINCLCLLSVTTVTWKHRPKAQATAWLQRVSERRRIVISEGRWAEERPTGAFTREDAQAGLRGHRHPLLLLLAAPVPIPALSYRIAVLNLAQLMGRRACVVCIKFREEKCLRP